MLKKKNSGDIDILLLITSIWREKYLILSITILFAFISQIIPKNNNINERFISKITVRDAPYFAMLDKQTNLTNKIFRTSSLREEFNNEFRLNLISYDLLLKFISQNSNIDELKSYLKKKNIAIDEYFQNSITLKRNEMLNEIELTLSTPLIYNNFLGDYVLYIKNHTENLVKTQLQKNILTKIDVYERNLKIAKEIGLNEPLEIRNNSFLRTSIENEEEVVYLGHLIIESKIENHRKYLKSLDDFSLEYNPILKKSKTIVILNSNIKPFKSPFFMAFIGLFFSFIIMYIKFIIQDIKKSNIAK